MRQESYEARITPACAGKSLFLLLFLIDFRDHPRMRREKNESDVQATSGKGSPPHAQGKDGFNPEKAEERRITPACAGKSSLQQQRVYEDRDHPRMRREKKESPTPFEKE